MSRSWSSIVRVPEAAVPKTKPKVVFHVFCADCGAETTACGRCQKNAIYEDGLCGSCFTYNMPSDWMCMGYVRASEAAEKIPFKCDSCRRSNPWRWEDDKEIVSYRYVPMSFSFPLSPTNVIRIAEYRTKGKVSQSQRHAEAKAASDKEMAFSGSYTETMRIYSSFFKDQPPSLADILAGRPVSGEQFFAAVKAGM